MSVPEDTFPGRASISFAGYNFAYNGRPHYTRQAKAESDSAGGLARREIVTYSIIHQFLEETFADNQAKYWSLMHAVKSNPEGSLKITDEFGNVLVDVLARPMENSLPDQWGQYLTEVTLQFQAVEVISGGVDAEVVFPGGAVFLKNVTGWRESIRTDRPSFQVNNRRESNGLITASGKIVAAPTNLAAGRVTELEAQRDLIRSIADHKEVVLSFGDFEQTVRIDSVDADIKDGTYDLEWNLTASYRRFPDGDYVEMEYEISTRDDPERSERITDLRGKIRASAIEDARQRLLDLNTQYKTAGRSQRKTESTEQMIEGVDGSDNLNELSFSTEYRETLGIVTWNLNVSDKADARSGQIVTTYSGKVTAIDAATALAKARALGAANYPILLTSTETVNSSQIGSDAVQFNEVSFSYEYVRQGTLTYAEVNGETNAETFGQSSTSVSGTATAATQGAALILARSFKPASGLPLSSKETITTVKGVNGALTGTIFTKVDFAYSFFLAAAAPGSIEYARDTTKDYNSREITTTYSGTAYGANEATANGLIDPLIQGAGRILRDQRTANRKSLGAAGGNDVLVSVTFSVSFVSQMLAGSDDILDAESTLAITYSVDHGVITPIPFGTPYLQQNCGLTPGVKSVSGSIRALNQATAQSWARGKRTLAVGGVCAEDPPEERTTTDYFKFSGTQVLNYRMQFTYAARYTALPFS